MNRQPGVPNSGIPRIDRAWYGRQAPAGSPVGDQLRAEFISKVLDICGATEVFWLPGISDTTSTTESSRNARVFTYDATIAGNLTRLGSGLYWTMDGTADEADTPDVAALSFGNSTVGTDLPFSIVAWVNQTATTGIKAIFSKCDAAGTFREYQLVLDAAEKLNMTLYDESADAYVGRLYNTALATGSVLMVAGTYNGNAATTGVKLYSAAAQVDDTDYTAGTYVAMENTATVGRIFSSGSGTPAEFFSGTGLCVLVVAKELSRDELWALKAAGNAFFDLSL